MEDLSVQLQWFAEASKLSWKDSLTQCYLLLCEAVVSTLVTTGLQYADFP